MPFIIVNSKNVVVAVLPIDTEEAPVQPAGQTAIAVGAVEVGMLGCLYQGGTFTPPPTGTSGFVDPRYDVIAGVWVDTRTPAEIQADLTSAVQAHLDTVAASRGYGDSATSPIVSACSYAASTHPKYGPEGRACLTWREACWDHCYQVLADVQSGLRVVPTVAELVAELPVMVWPA